MNLRQPRPRWRFLSPIYLFAVALHRSIYEWKIIVPYLPSQPTLSLGNLHAGGTGKTPIALWILEQLQPHVEDIAYVSRGYGRKTKECRRVELDDSADEVGDEARLVRHVFGHCPDVHVFVARKRREAFAHLPQKCPVILDDAFQHWDLQSPISLLICPYGDWYNEALVLPAGPLREAASAAQRASAILISKCPHPINAHERLAISKRLGLTKDQQLFTAQEVMGEPRPMWGAPAWCGDETALVFSGIGDPERFEQFACHSDRFKQGGVAATTLRFPDHTPLDPPRRAQIASDAYQSACNAVITTAKDLARLEEKPSEWDDLHIYCLPHEVDFGTDRNPFLLWLQSQWKAHGYRVPLPL
ncbi:MAG: tetraacyldisaccharide 4'-kinase [Schleiferiaceae bacterium]|nr:tetraacyldisaccharide 4'-kinase [Schleiferiaceae bacterium]